MTEILTPTAFTLQPIPGWPPQDELGEVSANSLTEEVSTYSLPAEVAVRVHKLANLTPQDISDLAWDLVLFNDMDRKKILSSYDLGEQDVADLQELPLFMAETSNAKAALKADPHLGVRRMAKAFLVQRVATLNELAISSMVEPAARLKSIDLLTKIAGLDKSNEDKGKGGVAVQINLGSSIFGQTPAQEVTAFVKDV